jgi:hypothetical protein
MGFPTNLSQMTCRLDQSLEVYKVPLLLATTIGSVAVLNFQDVVFVMRVLAAVINCVRQAFARSRHWR